MKQNLFTNPLDELFNIEEPGEMIEDQYMQVNQSQLATVEPTTSEKDAEDVANDQKIDEVYDLAITAYKQQTAMVEIIDPKFAARNAEVAANFLNIALNAATSKAKIKTDRKRVGMFNPAANANKTTNNVIVASQEDILKMIDSDTYKRD